MSDKYSDAYRDLPAQFGKVLVLSERKRDDSTVLKSMKRSCGMNPLGCLTKCIKSDSLKIKVWIRNYKEIRGILIGTVIAFDKHWNMVLSDVTERYLKPKKAKTPFLSSEKEAKDLLELPPKEPKQKKDPAEVAAAKTDSTAVVAKTAPEASDPAKETGEGETTKNKNPKKPKEKKDPKEVAAEKADPTAVVAESAPEASDPAKETGEGETTKNKNPKEPKQKKDPTEVAAEKTYPTAVVTETAPEASDTAKETGEGETTKNKKRKKRRTNIPTDRTMDLCFIRGDNIVMVAIVSVRERRKEDERSSS